MEHCLKFTIDFAPVTKKNHQEIHYKGQQCPLCRKGKTPFLAQGKVYREYEAACERSFPREVRRQIGCPVNIKATFYLPNARRVDLTNLLSALHDVLVKTGVLKDDSSLSPKIVVGTDGSRVLVDKIHPRTEVEITPWEECAT